MGSTFLLIAAALACEYSKSVAISPVSLLQGLSTRFFVYTGEKTCGLVLVVTLLTFV